MRSIRAARLVPGVLAFFLTGWMVKVLGTAERAQLDVEDEAIENALSFIDEMTDADTGRTGYTDTPPGPGVEVSIRRAPAPLSSNA